MRSFEEYGIFEEDEELDEEVDDVDELPLVVVDEV
jgi:hypothetical protein